MHHSHLNTALLVGGVVFAILALFCLIDTYLEKHR